MLYIAQKYNIASSFMFSKAPFPHVTTRQYNKLRYCCLLPASSHIRNVIILLQV